MRVVCATIELWMRDTKCGYWTLLLGNLNGCVLLLIFVLPPHLKFQKKYISDNYLQVNKPLQLNNVCGRALEYATSWYMVNKYLREQKRRYFPISLFVNKFIATISTDISLMKMFSWIRLKNQFLQCSYWWIEEVVGCWWNKLLLLSTRQYKSPLCSDAIRRGNEMKSSPKVQVFLGAQSVRYFREYDRLNRDK